MVLVKTSEAKEGGLKMQYEVEILDFVRDVRGFKLGTCDVKIKYSEEKNEIFRNIAVFMKENKKWISFPKFKKDEEWVLMYERTPPLDKAIYPKILTLLEKDFL